MLRASRLVLGLVIVLGLFVYFIVIRPQQTYYYAHHVKINGIYLLKPIRISDFELIDHHGIRFSKDNLKNHWSLLFFGFSHCDSICPNTLIVLNDMYLLLKNNMPENKLPQVVFISVDPERDTITQLNKFMRAYNSHFIAARTTPEKTDALEKELHVISEKIKIDGNKNQYSINHSGDILLINPKAEIQAYFSYPQQANKLANDYDAILKKETTSQTW
jgi:protein SCO1